MSTHPAIKMIANPVDNKIALRWAPTTHTAWEFGNAYGYTVQRVTLLRNNQPLKNKTKIFLSQQLVPLPLADWEMEVKQNKYAAVAAQALYGARFQITQQTTGIMQIVNQAKESEQRFAFALFAADYSPVVAEMSGLSYTDNKVSGDENYLYKVWVNMPDNRHPIDTGYVYTGLKEYRALPAPQKPELKFSDKQAIISWNYAYYESTYIAYVIERSVDGKNFISVTKDSIIPTENTPVPTGEIHVLDTLADNVTTYFYRVKGISAFGETGPVSQVASGHGKKGLSAAPAIRNVKVFDNKSIALLWEYPESLLSELTGFQVERSFTPKGPFETISPVLKSQEKQFTDNLPSGSNYYRIVALGTDDKSYSFPHLAQLTDSIPPAMPVGVNGLIDTTGVVTLAWERAKEDDILGYRVYRSNFDTHEYGQITVSPVQDPFFRDTINLRTLTKNVYYKIVAVDRHFNPSDFSEALVIQRPDVLPPAKPSISNIEYRPGQGIIVKWIASGSQDVKKYLLYRRTSSDNAWRLLIVIPSTDTTAVFTDGHVQNKYAYEYTLVAVDESGLESGPSIPIKITVNDRSNKPMVDKFAARKDIDNKQINLSWSYEAPDVKEFLIYRSDSDGRMRLFGSVSATIRRFSDKGLIVNTQYLYSIKAVFTDGGQSPFSKPLKVLY